VLTFRCARAALASYSAARLGAVLILSAVTWISARAENFAVGGCLGTRGEINCAVRWGEAGDAYVRQVPQPVTEADKTRATERDRKWLSRCRPVIAQDGYGVPRYHYSAAGCGFGVLE